MGMVDRDTTVMFGTGFSFSCHHQESKAKTVAFSASKEIMPCLFGNTPPSSKDVRFRLKDSETIKRNSNSHAIIAFESTFNHFDSD